MIVDLILDRKDYIKFHGEDDYDAYSFYTDVMAYESCGESSRDISYAMDYGTEQDVKRALCKYIEEQEYNPNIKDFINSVNWID